MCGRFTLTSGPQRVQARFGLAVAPDALAPRYNIAPSQAVLVILNRTPRTAQPARWGLIPHWAKDATIGHRMINARSETIASRAAFHDALERRRCLVPADGFYEWKREGTRRRTPFYLRPHDGEPLALAGLWDIWRSPAGEAIASCTIITTQPNEVVAAIHDRMPVILPPEAFDAWLAPAPQPIDALQAWLAPCPATWLEAIAVSDLVNSPDNDEPACIVPVR